MHCLADLKKQEYHNNRRKKHSDRQANPLCRRVQSSDQCATPIYGI